MSISPNAPVIEVNNLTKHFPIKRGLFIRKQTGPSGP